MRRTVIIIVLITVIATVLLALSRRSKETEIASRGTGSMKLISTAFEHGTLIPVKYTCDGQDVNPPLSFAGIPEEAKSLVLVVDDPDASPETWVHWTVWNIPPQKQFIAEAESGLPAGAVEGATSAGKTGYHGPCPPSGTHHYFFKAYALDAMLDLPAATDAAGLESAMEGHILDKAGLIGLYQRRKK
jgi:Raf kinase inhibitor-like YbhB/YbcL family protein